MAIAGAIIVKQDAGRRAAAGTGRTVAGARRRGTGEVWGLGVEEVCGASTRGSAGGDARKLPRMSRLGRRGKESVWGADSGGGGAEQVVGRVVALAVVNEVGAWLWGEGRGGGGDGGEGRGGGGGG